MSDDLDPIFQFVHEATAHFPRRKQRLMAAYYVRALQTGNPVNLRQAVPANLYPAVRHFLAESDWDHREVMWRAAAQVLPAMEVEWLACHVSTVADKWTFAWLGAYDAERVLPVDLVLVGPSGMIRSRPDYIAAQLELLREAPDSLLTRAPLGIADALAEDASVRRWLAERSVTYSAKVKPTARALGSVVDSSGRRPLQAVVDEMQGEANAIKDLPMTWAARSLKLRAPDGVVGEEVAIYYWHDDRLAAVVLTNERDKAQIARNFNPAQRRLRALPAMRWRRTGLRGAQAWEHHLALIAVLQGHRVAAELT